MPPEQTQQAQDPMIKFRSTSKKRNSKGGDWLVLYCDQAEVQAMYQALGAIVNNPNGGRLDVHTNKKQTADGSRQFDSTVLFVKPCGERPQPGQAPQQFVPRGQQAPATRQVAQQAYQQAAPAPRPAPPQQAYQRPAQPQYPQNVARQAAAAQPVVDFAPATDPNDIPF